jgi:hypothetical protein
VEVSSCRLRTTDCPTEDWEIPFKFAASPNATDLTVGDITGIEKKGWEYLWVRYADAEDEETLIQQPVAASHIEMRGSGSTSTATSPYWASGCDVKGGRPEAGDRSQDHEHCCFATAYSLQPTECLEHAE